MTSFLLSFFNVLVLFGIISFSSQAPTSKSLFSKTISKLIDSSLGIPTTYTTIKGTVYAKNTQLKLSLAGTNLALILKNRDRQEEVYQLRLTIQHGTFPFTFTFDKLDKIQTGIYLLSLLIFGYPHRLLWECTFFQQELIVNEINIIIFWVTDVCE